MLLSKKPFFSIIVPVFNEEQFIREALDSILAQTDSDWEAILIDDGSTDSSAMILDEYAKNDPRFRVFHKANGGQSTAINKGVEEARGEWLCWLSGDDFFDSQKLKLNREWIQANSNIHFFFSGFWLINPDGTRNAYNLDWLHLENSDHHLISLMRANYVMGISICIKWKAWIINGGFDEKLRYAHDLDMWLRLMLNSRTKYLPERTCSMRNHAGQESAQFPLAGLFDSSKSAIRLLNEHTFTDLFPNVDFHNPNKALAAFSHALNFIACEPTSNYYALGFHPLLQLRMIEWLWGASLDPEISSRLKTHFIDSALVMESTHPNSQFGFLWKVIRVTAQRTKQPNIYFSCEPHQIGEMNYYQQRSLGTDVAQALRTYLERFDGLSFTDTSSKFEPGCKLVLLLPSDFILDNINDPIAERLEKIWRYFVVAGYSVLLVGKSQHTIGLRNGLLFLGWNEEEDEKRLINSLGNLDSLIAFSHPESLKWVQAERTVFCDLANLTALDWDDKFTINLLNKIQSTPRKYNAKSRYGEFLKMLFRKTNKKIKHWRNVTRMLMIKQFSGD